MNPRLYCFSYKMLAAANPRLWELALEAHSEPSLAAAWFIAAVNEPSWHWPFQAASIDWAAVGRN